MHPKIPVLVGLIATLMLAMPRLYRTSPTCAGPNPDAVPVEFKNAPEDIKLIKDREGLKGYIWKVLSAILQSCILPSVTYGGGTTICVFAITIWIPGVPILLATFMIPSNPAAQLAAEIGVAYGFCLFTEFAIRTGSSAKDNKLRELVNKHKVAGKSDLPEDYTIMDVLDRLEMDKSIDAFIRRVPIINLIPQGAKFIRIVLSRNKQGKDTKKSEELEKEAQNEKYNGKTDAPVPEVGTVVIQAETVEKNGVATFRTKTSNAGTAFLNFIKRFATATTDSLFDPLVLLSFAFRFPYQLQRSCCSIFWKYMGIIASIGKSDHYKAELVNANSETAKEERQRVCKLVARTHNILREKHGLTGTELLECNDDLITAAQAEAKKFAQLQPDPLKNQIEKLSKTPGINVLVRSFDADADPYDIGNLATLAWYMTMNLQRTEEKSGTFMNIIWKQHKHLGLGIAFSEDNSYWCVVAMYQTADKKVRPAFNAKTNAQSVPARAKGTTPLTYQSLKNEVTLPEFLGEMKIQTSVRPKIEPAAEKPCAANPAFSMGHTMWQFKAIAMFSIYECQSAEPTGDLVYKTQLCQKDQKGPTNPAVTAYLDCILDTSDLVMGKSKYNFARKIYMTTCLTTFDFFAKFKLKSKKGEVKIPFTGYSRYAELNPASECYFGDGKKEVEQWKICFPNST